MSQPLRAQLGPVFLDGLEMPGQVRPLTPLPLTVSGYGPGSLTADDLRFTLADQPYAPAVPETETAETLPFVLAQEIEVGAENGRFSLSCLLSRPGCSLRLAAPRQPFLRSGPG
jgi:hypothetical protein